MSGAIGIIIHCWWEYKMALLVWKKVQVFIMLNIFLTIQSSNFTPMYFFKWFHTLWPRRNLHTNVYGKFIHNCQKLEAIKMSFSQWMDKQTYTETETPILWPPDVNNWLIGKDPNAGKNWGWEEKGPTEDEMVGCIIDTMHLSLRKLQEMVKDMEAWCAVVHGFAKSRIWLSDWTTTKQTGTTTHWNTINR